ncbi:MAG TPA: FAD-dependent oxidoreductase [Naasia sp.]|jgi:FAD/FMN-containing dehydrogenase
MFFSKLDPALRSALEAAVSGPVFLPGTPGCTAEVAGRRFPAFARPAAVVGATCAEDVAFAVRVANLHGVPAALFAPGSRGRLRGAGGIVLTTSRMTEVTVDSDAGTVRIGAGALWADVVAEAGRYGLSPLGDAAAADAARASTSTAVALATAGSLGALGRALGFDADRVRGFEVVTGDGRFLHVDAASDPELLAALLAGKAGRTIVTEVTISLVAIAGAEPARNPWAAEDADEVLRRWVAESAGVRVPARSGARTRELLRR